MIAMLFNMLIFLVYAERDKINKLLVIDLIYFFVKIKV